MTDYTNRFKIPILAEYPIEFYTKDTHLLLATNYTRIVIGQRGPYIEFEVPMINWLNTVIPIHEHWRTANKNAYYLEARSNCTAYVKLYIQKRTVDYADYKVGFVYISPFDLRMQDKTTIIDPLRS